MMNHHVSKLLSRTLTVIIMSLPGCTDTDSESTPKAETPRAKTKEDVLQGTVLRKEWSKSYESWNAGGSEYFVLDVGDATLKERSAAEGVILRPSQQASLDVFAKYVDKRVKVSGRFVAGKPYVPMDEGESYPLGEDGKPAVRGSGFVVSQIELLP